MPENLKTPPDALAQDEAAEAEADRIIRAFVREALNSGTRTAPVARLDLPRRHSARRPGKRPPVWYRP